MRKVPSVSRAAASDQINANLILVRMFARIQSLETRQHVLRYIRALAESEDHEMGAKVAIEFAVPMKMN